MTNVWKPPVRSGQALAVYEAAEADRARHPERYELHVEALVAAALGDKTADVLEPYDWQDALSVFVTSAQEDAQLNAVGLRAAAGSAIGKLQARMRISDCLQRNPQCRDRSIDRPIFIVGGWRTGTTFLQRMLNHIPGLRGLYPWELGAPWKAAGADEEERARLQKSAQAAHDQLHLLSPRLQQVHDSGADLPEECVLALGSTMRNWGFLSTMRLMGYASWLESQDFSTEYQNYANILRLLDAQDGRRFVLKAPAHTAELRCLLDAFPDAIVVHLHRDIVETIASGASLFAVFRSIYSDAVDGRDVGAFQADQTFLWFERARLFREECERAGRGNFVDIAYPDLVSDPHATVAAILQAAEVDWSDTVASAIDSYLALNRQHKHGRHAYTAEEFGLVPQELLERFKAYRERFLPGE